jgi:hypothetical protein
MLIFLLPCRQEREMVTCSFWGFCRSSQLHWVSTSRRNKIACWRGMPPEHACDNGESVLGLYEDVSFNSHVG